MSESYIQLPPDSTGKKVRAIYNAITGSYEEVNQSKDIERVNPVYVATVYDSTPSASKHHLTIWNGSTYYIRILKIIAGMYSSGAITGYSMRYDVWEALSVSGGASVVINKLDPRDPDISADVTAYTGATVSSLGRLLATFCLNPEETGGTAFIDLTPPKPFVISPNSGLTIQQYTATGAGAFTASVYFSVEMIRP
jgi:hypothetical protein